MDRIIKLKFKKIIANDHFAFILTEQYITGAFDTQTDLFILRIENNMKIKRLYPKIVMPFGLQMFLFYFGILAIPTIGAIIIFSIFFKRSKKKTILDKETKPKN